MAKLVSDDRRPAEDTPSAGELVLADILDVPAVQSLMDDFYALTHIGVGIIDLHGNVLVGTGWQDICTRFHRADPEACRSCQESDLELSRGIEPGTFRLYRRKFNMWDMATPIVVGDCHLGNIYLGQFLFDDETPDLEIFRAQARRFGFDEAEYLAALERVPRWSRETVDAAMKLYASLAGMLAAQSWAGIELGRSVADRERLIESLQRSESRYRDLVENLNDVVYSVALDGTLDYVSPAVTTVFGYAAGELVGTPYTDLVHPDDVAKIRRAFGEVISGKLKPREYRMLATTGEVHWMRTSSRPIVRDGAVVGMQGVLTDVTERRRSEDSLREALQWQEKIFEGSRDAVFISDEDARFTAVNSAAVALTGYSREELLGMRIPDLHDDPDLHAFDAFHSRILAGESVLSAAPVRCKDGRKVEVEFSNSPIVIGELRFMHTVARDVTDRRRAEQSLRQSEEKYRRLFTTMAEGFALHEILCDAEGQPTDYRFLEANPTFFELTGLEPDILGRTVLEVLPETEPFWIETYGRVALSGEPAQFEHYSEVIGKHFEVRAFSPQPGRFATVVLDVSKRIRVDEERSRLVEHVRGLAARLAQVEEAQRLQLARELHDRVGQNLTALGLNLTVLRNRLSPESLTEVGPRLDDADRLLGETAEEIRYVMAELRPPVLDAYGLVAALSWFAEVFTQRTGVTAVVIGSELEPRLRGDVEVAIFRIVQEALTNVAKHAQAGAVRIAVDQGPSGPRVTVIDDGIGFVPVPGGKGSRREGWGLTIMEERATAIGGALHVTSSRGEGTRVVLDLGGPGR